MIPELGHFALLLALVLSLLLGTLPLLGAARNDGRLMSSARPNAIAVFVLIALSFACLAQSFVSNDFFG